VPPLPPRAQTPLARSLKLAFCWSGFCIIWLGEILIHLKCGFSKKVYADPTHCIGVAAWSNYLVFAEGICRSGLAVVAAGAAWEFLLALRYCEAFGFLRDACSGGDDGLRLALPALALSVTTVAIGIWNMYDEDVPESIALYCHVADTFCHSVVSSAVLGLIYDFATAIKRRKVLAFFGSFVRCEDNIEQHGVSGEFDPDADVEQGGCFRTLIMWIAFAITLFCYTCMQMGYTIPDIAQNVLGILNVLCWGGLSWWLIECIFHLRQTLTRTIDGKALANLAVHHRPHNRSFTSGEGSFRLQGSLSLSFSSWRPYDERHRPHDEQHHRTLSSWP